MKRFPFYEEHPVTSPYGPRGGGFHGGTDFGWTPETGQSFPVCATDAGTVVYCADESAYGGGNVVNIDHDDGHQSRYFHLAYWTIEVGQRVAAGEQIAMSGDTGVPGQPHLHFELLDGNGNRYDPVTVLEWPDATTPPPDVPPVLPELPKGESVFVLLALGLPPTIVVPELAEAYEVTDEGTSPTVHVTPDQRTFIINDVRAKRQ